MYIKADDCIFIDGEAEAREGKLGALVLKAQVGTHWVEGGCCSLLSCKDGGWGPPQAHVLSLLLGNSA